MAAGRPRDFEIEKALEAAMQVFWKKGYEGASLSDLTEAMDINRPSLYAAFGNKEDLFLKALDHYGCKANPVCDALKEARIRDVVEKLFYGYADGMTDSTKPRGCLMINGAIACSETAEPVRRELIARRGKSEKLIRERFEVAHKEGELSPSSNPADLARYISTLSQGMAVQSASGVSRDDLRRVAELAIRNFPF